VSDVTDTTPESDHQPTPRVAVDLDLDAIQADLDGVQSALGRLAEGSYWTDEVTGEPIPGDVLAADPTARRAATVS
jgi:RNA polymerase-binding transcription factor DksA